jgi:hypothetical protein
VFPHRHSRRFEDTPADRQFRCEQLPRIADRLAGAIESLQRWDIRVAESGRLRAAEKVLRQVALAGTYPSEPEELHRVAEAIRTAQDFGQIMDALGPERSERLAGELQRSVKGTLEGRETAREPYQFHTQFWFGAALIRAGLDPEVPTDRRRNPDFVVCPGTVRYGVEVKRPSSERGAFDLLRSARDQLVAARLHGIVVMDLSDCLEDMGLRRVVPTAAQGPHEELKPAFKEFRDRLGNVVWDAERRQHRPGFSSVIGIWVLARGWRWTLDDLTRPEYFEAQGMLRFASVRGNVWYHRTDEFFRCVQGGLRDGGFFLLEAEQESSDPVLRAFWESG